MTKTAAEVETMARKATRSVLEQVIAKNEAAGWVLAIVSAELTRRDNKPFKTETDLMNRLQHIQNHSCFEHQDVLTWAAMCDDRAELERHVVSCERRAAEWIAPDAKGFPRRRKAA